MRKLDILLVSLLGVLSAFRLSAQVGINTLMPDTGTILDIRSSNKGILIPRIKEDGLYKNPPAGVLYYNTTEQKFKYKDSIEGIRRVNPLKEDALGNLTVPKTLTVSNDLLVNGVIGGNGVNVTNVNADMLDGQHGSYYSSVTDLTGAVSTLNSTISTNYNTLDAAKLNISTLTSDLQSLTPTLISPTKDISLVGGSITYKTLPGITFVQGYINFLTINDQDAARIPIVFSFPGLPTSRASITFASAIFLNEATYMYYRHNVICTYDSNNLSIMVVNEGVGGGNRNFIIRFSFFYMSN